MLAAFVALMLYSWPITDPDAWRGAIAGLLSAAAMGVQSTLVRLLLRGVPQTNVMTGNSTQLAIDATELVYARLRPARVAADADLAAQVAEARKRFATVFMVLMGFLVGALRRRAGLCYGAGPWSACLAIRRSWPRLVAWSAKRGGSDPV